MHTRLRHRPQWLVPLLVLGAIVLLLIVVSRLTVKDHVIAVEYRVTAAGAALPSRANLSWRNSDDIMEQAASVELPWVRSQRMSRFLSLEVAAQVIGEGAIRCEVWVNGAFYQGIEAHGFGATASCNAGYEDP